MNDYLLTCSQYTLRMECQGPCSTVGCKVGTVLLMALTCETEEHEFLLMLHKEEVGDASCVT